MVSSSAEAHRGLAVLRFKIVLRDSPLFAAFRCWRRREFFLGALLDF
jgi:hypothetical protein